MKRRHAQLPPNLPPIGLSLDEAAGFIGISKDLFNRLVATGEMPDPKAIGGRLVWDRDAVETCFRRLPSTRRGAPSHADIIDLG